MDSESKKLKNNCIAKKGKITFLTFVCPLAMQGQYSCLIILLPICANIGALDPSNKKIRSPKILDAAALQQYSELQAS